MNKVAHIVEVYDTALEKLAVTPGVVASPRSMEALDIAISGGIIGGIGAGIASDGDPKAVAAGVAAGAVAAPVAGHPIERIGERIGFRRVGKTVAKNVVGPLGFTMGKLMKHRDEAWQRLVKKLHRRKK